MHHLSARARSLRPRTLDLAFVLLIVVLAGGHDLVDPSDPRTALALLADVLLALPLLARRRRPFAAFLTVAAVALAQWAGDLRVSGDVAVLAALYSAGVYATNRVQVAVAAAIAELGAVMAVLRWAPPGQFLTGITLASGTVTAAWVLGIYVRTHRAYVASVVERAANAERERDQQALIATVSERARISREMHDIVAHSLSVMIALSDGAAIALDADPQAARDGLTQSSALGRQALGELRRLLGTLHDDDQIELAPPPGVADLDELVAKVRAAGLGVDLVIEGAPPALPPATQLTIYRMVQEALTNVLKHAPAATRATVTVRYTADGVGLEVENDDPRPRILVPADDVPAGRGLAGMRARAAVFAGSVETSRPAGGGWRVSSQLSLRPGGAPG